MRILILGATGQIGYALVQALAGTMHEVTVLVRDRHKLPFPDRVTVIEQRSFDHAAFITALDGIDHVIYGVGLPEQFRLDTSIFERVNVDLFGSFLHALEHAGTRPLTYISTYEVFAPDTSGVIREEHPIADPAHMTPYFRAMIRAYRLATDFAARTGLALTTIHPAALYGGVEASAGITTYIEHVARRQWWRVPAIVPGRFPVVHAESLADGIQRTLGHTGAYIISDTMTDLKTLAQTVRQYTRAIVPPQLPVSLIMPAARGMDLLAQITRRPPLMSAVQVKFITAGMEPRADKITTQLGWEPLPLAEGVRRTLETRDLMM